MNNEDRKNLNDLKSKFLSTFKNIKVEISNRRRPIHLRISGLEIDSLEVIKKEIGNYRFSKNTKYSKRYKLIYLNFKEKNFPLIITESDFIKSVHSITNKQLTPSALNISGEYSDYNVLFKDIIKGLDSLLIKPKLNTESLKDLNLKDPYRNILIDLLKKIALVNINKYELTEKELKIYKQQKVCIEKDYGELILPLSILFNKEYLKIKSVFIQEKSNAIGYDIKIINKYNKISKINIKSGNGSGQSFSALSNSIELLNKSKKYKEDSIHQYYLLLMKELSNKSIIGKDKILKISNILLKTQNLYSPKSNLTGKILNDFSKSFFNSQFFLEKNISLKEYSYIDFNNKVNDILKKFDIKMLGLPRLIDNKLVSIMDYNSYFNYILFSLQTVIAQTLNNSILNDIFNDLENKIEVIYLKEKNAKIIDLDSFKEYNKSYQFHYWSSIKTPLNNILGFKTIIS